MKLKINGSNFEEIFELWKFHFHWGRMVFQFYQRINYVFQQGENNYQGSEHLIDGRKYPLEVIIKNCNVFFIQTIIVDASGSQSW